MSQPTKNVLLSALSMALVFSLTTYAAETTPVVEKIEKEEIVPVPETAGTKPPITIKKGDCELLIGGKTKIDSYFQHNVYLLNQNIPDEQVYIKHCIDMFFDFVYGQERYGYKAAELYLDLRTKGVWGKQAGFADRESGPNGASSVKLANSIFGAHTHTTGKPLVWVKEGWLQFGLNAVFGASSKNLHFFKLGYFPFEMGRGIALGSAYGLNKEFLGLYSYPEDKGTPGVLLNGVLIKDVLTYDLYYSCFENRSRSLSDTLNIDKRRLLGQRNTPWRGIDKNDDLVGGRLKWKAVNDDKVGLLELEPYVFYNAASDQTIEFFVPDASSKWGSYGCALEHAYKNFEWGGEVAANYGHQTVFALDRNDFKITNNQKLLGPNPGIMVENYSHVLEVMPVSEGEQKKPLPALITDTKQLDIVFDPINVSCAANGKVLIDPQTGLETDLKNSATRVRPEYRNDFAGWMAVLDAAYKFTDLDLKAAIAYGYASGDINPHEIEKDKTYRGFVGLHEMYAGKRVPSVLILGERYLQRPVTFQDGFTDVESDVYFSDLHQFGFGATWAPKKLRVRNLSINPNAIFFWKAIKTKKIDQNTGKPTPCDASKYAGLELNLIAKCSLLKDLILFGNFAIFMPGQLFKDISGSKPTKSAFDEVLDDPRNDIDAANIRRLHINTAADTAYYFNMGFEYKF